MAARKPCAPAIGSAGPAKPFSASSAENRPLRAALPTLTLLAGQPRHSHRPADWVEALPRAHTIWFSFSPSSLRRARRRAEDAAGRGDVPALGVMAGRDRAAHPAFDLEAEHEGQQQLAAPSRAAARPAPAGPARAAPSDGRRSAGGCRNSRRRWRRRRSGRPHSRRRSARSGRRSSPACRRRTRRAIFSASSTGSVRQPAIATAKKFSSARLASWRACSGMSSHRVSTTKRARFCVTPGLGSMIFFLSAGPRASRPAHDHVSAFICAGWPGGLRSV